MIYYHVSPAAEHIFTSKT